MKHLSVDGHKNLGVSIAMSVLAIITVFLRFLVRLKANQQFAIADWLCVLSLALFLAYIGSLIHYIVNDSTTAEFNLALMPNIAEAKNFMKMMFTCELLFGATITAVKMSTLFFYYSLFSVSRTFRHVLYITGTLCVIWFTVVTFLIIFQCKPISAFWDHMALPPSCHSPARVLLGYEITNLFLDVAIVCLPIGMVRTLHLPISRKISVGTIFLLGGFVCIASSIRLRYLWIMPHPEIAMNVPMVMVWSSVQLGLANVCCSLPTFGPVLKASRSTFVKIQIVYSSLVSRKTNSASESRSWVSKKRSTEDVQGLTWQQIENRRFSFSRDSVSADQTTNGTYPLRVLPPNSIAVKKTVEVV